MLALALAFPASAQFKPPNVSGTGLPTDPLPVLIAQVVRAALTLVAVIALGFIVYGGFRYIISRGDEREVEDAKKTITYAIIGIIAIGLAFAIVSFVINIIDPAESLPAPRPDGGR